MDSGMLRDEWRIPLSTSLVSVAQVSEKLESKYCCSDIRRFELSKNDDGSYLYQEIADARV